MARATPESDVIALLQQVITLYLVSTANAACFFQLGGAGRGTAGGYVAPREAEKMRTQIRT